MPGLFAWKEDYSVGIAEIDRQHMELIGMITDLHDAMMQGRGGTVLETILERLVDYTKVHFKTEEDYFKKYAYPQAAEHIAEHEKLVADVERFNRDYLGHKAILSVDLLDFLSDWLTDHIIGSDKLYAPFLKEKGLR